MEARRRASRACDFCHKRGVKVRQLASGHRMTSAPDILAADHLLVPVHWESGRRHCSMQALSEVWHVMHLRPTAEEARSGASHADQQLRGIGCILIGGASGTCAFAGASSPAGFLPSLH